jgi:hypothetical protein
MSHRTGKEREQMNSSIWLYEGPRRLLAVASVLAVLCVGLLSPGRATAAVGSANWQVITQTDSIFTPEAGHAGSQAPAYLIRIKNIGSAPTVGPYTVVDRLSPGVSISTAENHELATSSQLTCTVVENPLATITCTGSKPIQPGIGVYLEIPIVLANGAISPVTNEVEIEGGGVAAVSESTSTPISLDQIGFGFLPPPKGVTSVIAGDNGEGITQAGAYPTEDTVAIDFAWPRETRPEIVRLPDGGVKNLEINLPKGMVVNPASTPAKCSEAQLQSASCPPSSQVGTQTIITDLGGLGYFHVPIYNMKAPTGIVAVLGVPVEEGVYVHILGKVRSEGDYGISSVVKLIVSKVGVLGFETELWGDPTSAIHDANRGQCAYQESGNCPLTPDERTETPLLTTPTSCEGPLVSSGSAVSYGHPEDVVSSTSQTAPMSGCNQLEFDPSISAQPTTPVSEAPTGLSFDLHQRQTNAAEAAGGQVPLSTANLKDAAVALPAGLALNPSAGNGLASCSPAQIGLKTPVGQAAPTHFNEVLGGCPAASKLGTVEVDTPVLENPLLGSVYVATPFANPFSSLLAIYLAVEDERTGVVAKLPGLVEANPTTGQLTVTFRENPELPIEDVKLNLFNGPRAALTSPLACGSHTTTSDLTPWTTPEGADAHPSSTFQTQVAAAGSGACPGSEAEAPKTVSFEAGTASPLSGAYSPFSLRIARKDGTQHISGIETLLPEGLLGKLAGVPYCPESGIARAISRETPEGGKLEQSEPSCPASSEVGSVQVTAGSGISPIPVSGHAYLAGPYKGAPLSLIVIVPAVAGPFDLGTVVDRVALHVGEFDARIRAVADPFPTIRAGIPLDVRTIELNLSRPGFTLNPTSCEAAAIEGSVTTQVGQSAALKNSFQVGECKRLAFKPKLKLSLKGATKRSGHPALKAVVTYPKGGSSANIAAAQVGLPHSEFLDQGNIKTVCTQPELKADACPAKSIYGFAKAWTPLLEKPLEGPVYLGVGFGHKLPDLVADLNGQIRILLHGKVDTDKHEGIRNTFEAVPDAPVSKFILELKGGKKKGLLENSENICRKTQKAEVAFTAQNGRREVLNPTIGNSCGGKGKRHKKGGGGKARGHKKRGR